MKTWTPGILLFLSTVVSPAAVYIDWFEYVAEDPAYEGADLAPGEFHNPILPGFYPDPSIVRVGEDFYLVNSSFAWFPGVPIFHSRDLVHWVQLGHVLDRPGQLDLDGHRTSRGIFAPTIEYHDGRFYMVTTLIDTGGNFYVTAEDPAGPWSDPVWLDFDGIDPSIFFDESTGRAWMLNNGAPEGEPRYEGHRAIWLQAFDPEAGRLVGERKVILDGGIRPDENPIWIEGPHIFKRGDWYYLHCAEGGTSVNHRQVVLRSRDVEGPYEPWSGNPILTQQHLPADRANPVSATGHADLVELPGGDWWAVFLGTRPYRDDYYNTGRQTFLLPVTWTDDGWPYILSEEEQVPFVREAPDLPKWNPPEAMGQGNFSWRDDFGSPVLHPYWAMLRTPRDDPWWSLGDPAGVLRLEARPVPLTSTGSQPAFMARRQQHHAFSATLSLEVPDTPGVDAGMAVFLDEGHYYFLGLRTDGKDLVAFVERADGDVQEVARRRLPPASTQLLRVRGVDQRYAFSVSSDGHQWTELGDFDARILSIAHSWGFTGVMMGPHVRMTADID